jgi:hypothetical protein
MSQRSTCRWKRSISRKRLVSVPLSPPPLQPAKLLAGKVGQGDGEAARFAALFELGESKIVFQWSRQVDVAHDFAERFPSPDVSGVMIPCPAPLLWSRAGLRHLLIEPELALTEHRWHGCTPLALRVLSLFSYRRCVTVDRVRREVRIATRRFWFFSHIRKVRLDEVERLVCRAQAMPTGFPLWRVFSIGGGPMVDSDIAFYYFALRLRQSSEEVPLFTVLESLPVEDDWMTRVTGESDGDRIGDEGATHLLDQLREYLGLEKGRE